MTGVNPRDLGQPLGVGRCHGRITTQRRDQVGDRRERNAGPDLLARDHERRLTAGGDSRGEPAHERAFPDAPLPEHPTTAKRARPGLLPLRLQLCQLPLPGHEQRRPEPRRLRGEPPRHELDGRMRSSLEAAQQALDVRMRHAANRLAHAIEMLPEEPNRGDHVATHQLPLGERVHGGRRERVELRQHGRTGVDARRLARAPVRADGCAEGARRQPEATGPGGLDPMRKLGPRPPVHLGQGVRDVQALELRAQLIEVRDDRAGETHRLRVRGKDLPAERTANGAQRLCE
jgi:hypothetical protein